jgi:hypothetical protein
MWFRPVLPGVAIGLAGLLGCSTAATPPADADVTAAFTAMTAVSTIGQNCMPVVAADPLSLSGSITLTNTGTVPIELSADVDAVRRAIDARLGS